MGTTKEIIKRILFETKGYRISSIFDRCYILCYHMIAQQPNGFYPQTSVEEFERHIVHLTRYYKVVALEEIVARIEKGRSLRGRVAITFDDGFRDNFENAFPILNKHKIPATMFLTTGNIERQEPPWFIKLRYAFMKTKKRSFNLHFDEEHISAVMKTRSERFLTSDMVMRLVHKLSDSEKEHILRTTFELLDIHDFKEIGDLILNWDQIIQMSKNNISFGAHTVSHPVLSKIPLMNAEAEIMCSKEAIERQTGREVTSFAYPFGKRSQYTEEVRNILRPLKFKCAVTTESGVNNHRTNIFELNRHGPWEMEFINVD